VLPLHRHRSPDLASMPASGCGRMPGARPG